MNLYHRETKRFQKPLENATINYFHQMNTCAESLLSEQAKMHGFHVMPLDTEPSQFRSLELAFGFDYLWPRYTDAYFEHNKIEAILDSYKGLIRCRSSTLLEIYHSARKREIESKARIRRFSCHKPEYHKGRYHVSEVLKIATQHHYSRKPTTQ
jgi:hypothetical protein